MRSKRKDYVEAVVKKREEWPDNGMVEEKIIESNEDISFRCS